MVAQKHPDALFLVAGPGEHEDMLRQMIEAEQLTTHVRLLGYRNDVYELLQICTLFVMPSLWEGLGVVLLEAGACRVPVVATNVGGIPEVIEHSANGLLVPPKDEYALAEAIIQLLDNPEQRHTMAERGRRIVENQYSSAALAERMESLYESLWEQHCAKNRSPQYSR
jgi:glycosyltransferase involved in cell wall biosynthesis